MSKLDKLIDSKRDCQAFIGDGENVYSLTKGDCDKAYDIGHNHGVAAAVQRVATMLPAHSEEIASEAIKRALDVACVAQCHECRKCVPMAERMPDADPEQWWHASYNMCGASLIQAEFKRCWPEEFV